MALVVNVGNSLLVFPYPQLCSIALTYTKIKSNCFIKKNCLYKTLFFMFQLTKGKYRFLSLIILVWISVIATKVKVLGYLIKRSLIVFFCPSGRPSSPATATKSPPVSIVHDGFTKGIDISQVDIVFF